MKFGLLSIIRIVGKTKYRQSIALCKCKCGNKKLVTTNHLKSGGIISCGCYRKKNNKVLRLIHGESSSTKEYRCWRNMKERCHNINNGEYKNYGARGIKVCPKWRNSFLSFIKDIGRAPSKTHSLDRINNNKGYSPSNCRWATPIQQANNKRNNKKQ